MQGRSVVPRKVAFWLLWPKVASTHFDWTTVPTISCFPKLLMQLLWDLAAASAIMDYVKRIDNMHRVCIPCSESATATNGCCASHHCRDQRIIAHAPATIFGELAVSHAHQKLHQAVEFCQEHDLYQITIDASDIQLPRVSVDALLGRKTRFE